MFRARRRHPSRLRQFVYVSDLKLQGLLEQIPVPTRRDIAAQLKLDLKLISLTLTSSEGDRSLPQEGRIAKLALIEEHLRRAGQIGDLGAEHGYFSAEIEMDWMPLDDDQTVLFCGYTNKLLLTLGGSTSHLLGRPKATMQLGSQPYTIRAAIHGAGIPFRADLARDLLAASKMIYVTPQPMRVLASTISRGPIPRHSAPSEYLLGTPLYVEVIDRINP